VEKTLYTYALASALYDSDATALDTYLPFVLAAVRDQSFTSPDEIQQRLRERFGLAMPIHVLEQTLHRADRKRLLDAYKGQYKLSAKGAAYLDISEKEREVQRRINALLNDLVAFFSSRSVNKQVDELYKLLVHFIDDNIDYLREWLLPVLDSEAAGNQLSSKHESSSRDEQILIEYIETAEQEKPDLYKTIYDLVIGSIIALIIQSAGPQTLQDVRGRDFQHCQVFLDTNYLFNLFGLNPPRFHEPARELVDLLKRENLVLKVFPFTVDEICRVLNGYPDAASNYPATIKVDTLYSHLRTKGWTKSDVSHFLANIEKTLSNEGIVIERDAEIDLTTYEPQNGEWRALMAKYKPEQSTFHQNHDLAAIEMIQKIRKHRVRRIEDSKAFFLSSDAKLSQFDLLELGHKDNSTVCEVIHDRLMATVLWLKNPTSTIPLKSIIAAHSKDFLIDRRLWERFNEVLRKLRQDGKITQYDVSLLFYNSFIEETLLQMDETDADEITFEFVMREVEEASKRYELEKERALEEFRAKEEEYIRQLEKLRKISESIDLTKKRIQTAADQESRTWSLAISVAAALALVPATAFVYRLLHVVDEHLFRLPGFVPAIFSALFGGGSLLSIPKCLYARLRRELPGRIYRRKLRNLGWSDSSCGDNNSSSQQPP